MHKVAYIPIDRRWLKNEMFNPDSRANENSVFSRYIALRDFLLEKGISLNTFDTYSNPSEVDAWIFADPFMGIKISAINLKRSRMIPKKSILLLIEPPVVDFWGWFFLPLYRKFFGATLTWDTRLAKKKNTFHYFLPPVFQKEKCIEYRKSPKKSLSVFIHSNKKSVFPGELYSLRRKMLEYYEKRRDKTLDLFGRGWDRENKLRFIYKGTTEDKLKTISEHWFNFCIDNSLEYGYITYDLFLSIAVGTVPVYLPVPDASDYIPSDIYVDFGKFKDLDELTNYLLTLKGTEAYEAYKERGLRFLNTDDFQPFTVEKFCKDFYRAIQKII